MKTVVFMVEEQSIVEMLKSLLPNFECFKNSEFIYIPHEGKQDLLKSIPRKLKAWKIPNTFFVVIIDKDSNNCLSLKDQIRHICFDNNRSDVLIRIVCHELENWYLGDPEALIAAYNLKNDGFRNSKKFRDPDSLSNAYQELKRIVPTYQKVSGSRILGKYMSLTKNSSKSFNCFISGLLKLLSS